MHKSKTDILCSYYTLLQGLTVHSLYPSVLKGGIAGIKRSCSQGIVSTESHCIDPVTVTLETST